MHKIGILVISLSPFINFDSAKPTVGAKIKFTFRFCTTVILRYKLVLKKKWREIFTTEA